MGGCQWGGGSGERQRGKSEGGVEGGAQRGESMGGVSGCKEGKREESVASSEWIWRAFSGHLMSVGA